MPIMENTYILIYFIAQILLLPPKFAVTSFKHASYTGGFQMVISGPAASTSALPGNLLGIQILRLHPRPIESETLGLEPSKLF